VSSFKKDTFTFKSFDFDKRTVRDVEIKGSDIIFIRRSEEYAHITDSISFIVTSDERSFYVEGPVDWISENTGKKSSQVLVAEKDPDCPVSLWQLVYKGYIFEDAKRRDLDVDSGREAEYFRHTVTFLLDVSNDTIPMSPVID